MAENTKDLLKGKQYISIETYRKSGEAVRTPVWFAQEENRLYIWTSIHSGKVKRIRRCPQVKIAPSDMKGTVQGPFVSGEAGIYLNSSATYEHGNRLINRKYGLLKRIIELFSRGPKEDDVILKVTLMDQ